MLRESHRMSMPEITSIPVLDITVDEAVELSFRQPGHREADESSSHAIREKATAEWSHTFHERVALLPLPRSAIQWP